MSDKKHEKDITPGAIWKEYERGRNFKGGIGENGMYEQNRRNERFYHGDQWHGAKTGGERPLVRHNVIKRIGDYKTAVIGAAPIAVSYSLEGVPNTVDIAKQAKEQRQAVAAATMNPGAAQPELGDAVKNNLVMSALSDYFKTTAERLKLDDLKAQMLEDAYVRGTGVLYTYWDPDVQTGLYADEAHQTAIRGDIMTECLDIENVYFGDPNVADVQKQPYILIVQRKSVKELRQIAKRNGVKDLDAIKPDSDIGYMAGDRSQQEQIEQRKATVITRLWRETNDKTGKSTIKAIMTVEGTVIRREWDLGIRLYPLVSFMWQRRKGCAYGDSEVTYLIPNQIAINRMITASVWAVMMTGVPMTVINGDVVHQEVTNDPGQVIHVYGPAEEVRNAVSYVTPPSFSPQFDVNINGLINNTLSQSGANDAALGNMRPDNAAAIIATREAATTPLQPVQNRFYSAIEDLARVWAEFWVMKYGARSLKITDKSGTWYMPFNGDEYRDLLISAKVDVGASGVWSESQSIATLDNLLAAKIIDPLQYLERVPKGIVPDQQGLVEELKKQAEEASGAPQGGMDMSTLIQMLPPEYQEQLQALPPEQQEQLLMQAMSEAGM